MVRRERTAHLLILGDGEDRAQLQQLIESLGLADDVSLPGSVANPMPYLKAADVVVVSSAWEGLSGVLIEALSVGTPVVSTDCPSGPREVLDGDRLGKLVPVGDYEALARATLDTLARPPAREPLVERGRYFSADRAAGEYLELINRL